MNKLGTKRYIAFAAILLALSGAAWGQIAWDGGGDGTTWTDANNWLPNTVPGPGDTVNFFAAGFEASPTRTITIAGPVTVAGITTTNNQDDTFTLTFTGAGSLTVNGDMEFFRPTLDLASDTATYVFDLDVTCTGTVTTHTGTTVSVPAGNQFQANIFRQSATNSDPDTILAVAGTLVTNTLNLSVNAFEGMQLQVALGGLVRTGTLTRNAAGPEIPSVNNGTIISGAAPTNVDFAGGNPVIVGAAGDVRVWTGLGGDDLASNGANWDLGTPPPATTGTAIFPIDANPIVDVNYTLRNIVVQSPRTVVLTVNAGTLTIAAGGTLQNDGTLTVTGAGNLNVAGTTLNTGSLTTAGVGTRTLAATTNTGTITVGAGTLTATNLTNSGTVAVGANTLTATGYTSGGGDLVTVAAGGSATLPGTVGTLTMTGGSATVTGNITTFNASGTSSIDCSGTIANFTVTGGTTTLASGITATTLTNDGTITAGANSLTVNGVTDNTGGTITAGTNTLTLTGATNNTGGTINVGTLGATFGGNFTGGTLNGNGGANPTISFRGTTTTMGTVAIAGDTVLFDGTFAQGFDPGAGNTYAAVTVNKTGGTLTVNGNPLSCTTLTLTASTGCTFATPVTAPTLTLAGTTGTIEFSDSLTVATNLTNAGGTFALNLYGNGTTITPAATFNTNNTVTIGDSTLDTITFTGGFSHTTGATALSGNLVTTGNAVTLYDGITARTLTINANSTINTGAGGNITAHTIARGGATPWTLGLTAGTGNITITGTVGAGLALGALSMSSSGTFQTNSTVSAASVGITGGAVDLNGNVTAPGGFSSSGTTFDNTGATITTTGTNIAINHSVVITIGAALTSNGGTIAIESPGAVTIGAALSSGAGNIDIDSTTATIGINAPINSTTGLVTIDSSGLTTITDNGDITTTTGNVTFGSVGTGALSTAGEITTGGGNIVFTRDTTITAAVALTTGGGGGDINFMAALEGVPLNADTLSLTAGNGSVVFTSTVGSGESLGAITVISATNFAGNAVGGIPTGSIRATSLTQNAGIGTTRLGAITVTGTVGITVSTAAVFLTGPVSAPGGFSSSGTGATSNFDNTGATITTAVNNNIVINHPGAVTIGAALTSVTGNINIGAAVAGTITLNVASPTTVAETTGGNITFNRPVTLGADTVISTGALVGGSISFGAASSITGAQSLTLTAGTGSVELLEAAGTLTSLTVTGASAIFWNNITTSGAAGVDVTATTITLDELTITAGTNLSASINLNGAVALTGGPASLSAVDDITFASTVSGTQNLTVATSAALGSIVTFTGNVGTAPLVALGPITITNARDVVFNGSVRATSLVQNVGLGTTTLLNNVTTSSGVNITAATINLDSATPQTIQVTGAGIARFNGAVTLASGSTTAITTFNGPISLLSTVNGGDELTVTAGMSNAVTFGSALGDTIGGATPLTSLVVTGGNVAFYGIGNAGVSGVTGTVQVTASSAIDLYGDFYRSGGAQTWTATTGGVRYRATANGTWQAGGGISCPATDLYLDHEGQTLTIASDLSCRNLYFYRGALSCTGVTFTINLDLAIFGNFYSADDPEWTTLAPQDTRYAYSGASTLSFYPNGGAYSATSGLSIVAPNATFSGAIGATFNVSGNFYVNGTDMDTFILSIPNNANNNPQFNSGDAVSATQWGTPYAVAFNMTVTASTTSGGWVAASTTAQGVTNGGPVNGNWQFARPIISAARTIYDNILYITFMNDLTNTPMSIENSSGQISAAISAVAPGGIYYNSGGIRFDAVSANPDGTGALLASGVSGFYLRHSAGSWNTDARGTSSGATESTNRSNVHRVTVPDLSFLKGLLYAEDGKTMVQNYGNHGVAVYQGTTDGCRPTLVEVRTGQEQHDPVQANQYPYDAHNFIEFRYSEPVYIGGFDALVAAANWPIPYARAQDSFAAIGDWGGAIEISGSDLEIVGYATIDTGVVNTGTRGDYAGGVSPDLSDTTIHGLYRDFSVDGNPVNFATQDHRLRIAIAGWCEETLSPPHSEPYKWFYQGFINNATLPSGTVHVLPNNFIRDRAATPNVLEHQSSIAAGYGDSEYAKAAVTVNNGTADLYGPWDTTRPVFAGVMPAGSWGTGPTYHEAIPQASLAGNVNRLEMHFFDNEVPYTIPLYQYQWVSRSGWFTPTSLPIQTAPETFGGSRPDDGTYTRPTSGGVRDSSFVRANEGAFTVTNVTVAETASTSIHLPGFLTRVSSVFFNLTLPLDVADDPYQTILIDEGFFTWPIAAADLRVSYSAFPAAGGGFVTDLAGNLLSTVAPLTCLDRAPPQVVLTLAGVNRNEVLVLFSKNMSAGTADAGRIRIRLTDGGGPDDVIPASVTFNPLTPRILRFTFPDSVSAEHILNAGSIIWFETGNWQPNPETGIPEDNTYYGDIAGNFVPVGETHRLTDLGIGILDVLFASDGVNADGVFGAGEGALRVFDGTGSLLDRNVTIGTRLTSGMASPLPLTMYFDANPGAATAPNLFNSAANAESRLWLPSVLPGFNLMGNGAARALAPDAILNGLQTLRNFTIPEADVDMEIGNSMDMVFRYGGLFCVRLDDETDIASVAPWTFRVSETRKQRGGVTILNNVIDSNRRERTMLRVELPRAGNLVIQVFTLDGNLVRVLERNRRGGGTYTYEWDGTNAGNRPVARGMYFIRVVGPDIDEIRKVMVVKE